MSCSGIQHSASGEAQTRLNYFVYLSLKLFFMPAHSVDTDEISPCVISFLSPQF